MGETEPAVPLASLPIILKQSDLDELRNPSRFLSDVFVEFYFSYIKYLFPSDSILFVPPTVCFLLANSKDTEDIQGCIKPLELTSKDLIIFPVNNGGYHWSLLVYHRGLDFFVHHDSMRGSNNSDAKKLYKSVKGFVKEKVVDNENPEKEEEKKKKKKKKKKKRVWHHDPRYMKRRLQYGGYGRPYGRYGTPYGEFGRPNGRWPYDMPDFDGFGGPNYGMPGFGGRPCDRPCDKSFGRIFRRWPNDTLPYCEYGSPCGEYGGPDEFEFSLSPHDRMRFAEYLKNNQDYEDKDDLKHTKHVKAMIKRFKQEQQMKMFSGCNDVERPEPMDETSDDDEWTDASSSDDEGAPEFHQWSTPQQTNAHDCGLYVMAIAKVICKWYSSDSLDKEEDWRQEIQVNVDVSLQSTMRFHILQLIESASAGELGTVTCTVEEPKSPALEDKDKDANGCGTSRPMSTTKEDQNAKAAIDYETSGPKEENQDANGCGTALPEIESCSSMEVDTSGPLSCGVEENKDANDCGTVLLPEIESRIGMEETSGSVSCGLEFKSSLHFQRRAGQGAEFHSQPENQEANDCGTTLKWPLPLTESCCDGMKEKEEEVAKDFETSSRAVSSSGVEEKGSNCAPLESTFYIW